MKYLVPIALLAVVYFSWQKLNEEPEVAVTSSSSSEQPRESVFDPMVGTIDKAEAVEDLNLDRKSDMDQAIANQE